MTDTEDYLAYFKYKGELVKDGYLGALKAADALQGIDEVMRFFLIQADESLAQVRFEIPIGIRRGSWEALIPHGFNDWLITAIGAGAVAYSTTAVNKIAENDFEHVRTKDIVKAAVKGIKWVLKIAKHVGSLAVRKFRQVEFSDPNTEGQIMIGLENEKGEVLYVPQEYLETYRKCPEKLFDKLMRNVEPEREFEIGFNPIEPVDKDDTSGSVIITEESRAIFTNAEKEDAVLFPELKHGDFVTLEGHVSRGNENSNTIGFEYKGHVLTCIPTTRAVKDYKPLLFTNCRMEGQVDRSSQYSTDEKRPHIKFSLLEGLPQFGTQGSLF